MSLGERLEYRPLHIDPVIEADVQRRDVERATGITGFPERVSRWITRKRFLRLYVPPPHGHASIQHQMEARTEFSAETWAKFPRPLAEVRSVLELMRDDLDWPNHHFLPDDPFPLLTLNNDDMPWEWFFTGVSLHFKVRYTSDEMLRMYHENWTVGRLVLDILERLPPPEPPLEPKRPFWRRFARR